MPSTPVRSGTQAAHTPGARRGRHRKPRPRRLLLTATGLMLAAALLALTRITSAPPPHTPGTTRAAPRPAPATEAAPPAPPPVTPTASPPSPPPATARAIHPPRRTAAPTTPRHTSGTTHPRPKAPAPGHPEPPPSPPTATATATATASRTDPVPTGVCLPLIGLCVDVPGDPASAARRTDRHDG